MSALTVVYEQAIAYRAHQPQLQVVLEYEGRAAPPVWAILDSGAGFSMFPREMATILGIDLSEYDRHTITTAGDPTQVIFVPVRMTLAGKSFNTEVWFNTRENFKLFLLGRHDAFHEFIFGFDGRNQRLLLAPAVRMSSPL